MIDIFILLSQLYNETYTWIISEFASNDFLVGTTIPFILAGILYFLKNFVFKVWNMFIRYFTVNIRLNHTLPYYRTLVPHIFKNYVWGVFKRDFTVDYEWTDDNDKANIRMSSGYGKSIAIICGCLGYIDRIIETSDSHEFKEYTVITALTFFPKALSKKIYADMTNWIEESKDKNLIQVWKSCKDGRELITKKPKRPLHSVFIPQNDKKKIMQHLNMFINSEESYTHRGIPWHTGIIFHGPSGTGKTSFIHAIASELNRDIHYHSGGSLESSGYEPASSILVLEDMDVTSYGGMIKSRDKQDENDRIVSIFYSMSDILNYLDGFLSPHGMIVIATTNCFNKLDPAIIRPGRFDINLKIDKMKYPEYIEMCKFYGQEPMLESSYVPDAAAKIIMKNNLNFV